jgi:hypothetical protein
VTILVARSFLLAPFVDKGLLLRLAGTPAPSGGLH